jgi:ADP-ribose pyrophosphatase YjhB (NUDIX family)
VEPGETLRVALAREMREETGLEVRVARLVCLYERLERCPPHRLAHHHVVADYRCMEVGGRLQAGSDVDACRLVTFREALDLPCTEGLLPLLARVLGQRQAARGRTRVLAHGTAAGHHLPVG